MADRRPTFSVHDGWMIDIFTSIGMGLVFVAALCAVYKAIFSYPEDSDGGGAALVLGAIFLFWSLTRLRRARAARDADAAEENEAQTPATGRARRGGR